MQPEGMVAEGGQGPKWMTCHPKKNSKQETKSAVLMTTYRHSILPLKRKWLPSLMVRLDAASSAQSIASLDLVKHGHHSILSHPQQNLTGYMSWVLAYHHWRLMHLTGRRTGASSFLLRAEVYCRVNSRYCWRCNKHHILTIDFSEDSVIIPQSEAFCRSYLT